MVASLDGLVLLVYLPFGEINIVVDVSPMTLSGPIKVKCHTSASNNYKIVQDRAILTIADQ